MNRVVTSATVLVAGVMLGGCGLTSFNLPVEVNPLDLATLDELPTVSFCTTLAVNETFASVSPEGHAWLLTPTAQGPRFRVLDPYRDGAPALYELDMPEVQQTRAWSGARATFVADNTIWRLPDPNSRIRLSAPPVTVGPDLSWCGELDVNGVLVADGQWVEQQVDTWYVWQPTAGDDPLTGLITRDGQCTDPAGNTWGLSDDGRLWRVAAESATFFEGFQGWTSASASADDLGLIISQERLWIGQPDAWTGYELEGDEAMTEVVGGGEALWVAAGTQALRYTDGRFSRVSSDLAEPIERIHPHAHGAWFVSGKEACHYAEDAPAIRVTGIRPHQVIGDEPYDFVAEVVVPGGTDDPSAFALSATVDGTPVETTPDGDGRIRVTGTLAGGSATFGLEARSVGQSAVRELSISKLRLPGQRSWAVDIEPIFLDHCAGCHVTNGVASPMETYEIWVERAEAVEARVLRTGDMPPQDPNFGDAERTIIEEWLNGGLAP